MLNHTDEAIPRSRVFVLIDGVFVVKWDEHQVQELLTGHYRNFERRDFGAAITDFELNQLKQAGIVKDFDREQVWLSSSPERSKYYQLNAQRRRIRSYYLHTTLPATQMAAIDACLSQLGVDDEVEARIRDDYVVIWGTNGRAFADFEEAEEVRQFLASEVPSLFQPTVIAFIETTKRDG
ncbi:MAG: hypothetical protein MUF87_03635 [Anaerolineae bacterium]|jgi:hypothetical protein|nr:hypothetical protein [Anaerolineae bacterium]